MWLQLENLCSVLHAMLMLPKLVITESRYKIIWKWLERLYIFEVCNCALSCNKQSKYANCTVNPWKYPEVIHFHYHREACVIHYFDENQMPLLMYMIQYRICVRPRYFINLVRSAWAGQNMIQLIQMTWPSFNSGGGIITENTSNCVSDSLSLEYTKSGTTVFNISSSASIISNS